VNLILIRKKKIANNDGVVEENSESDEDVWEDVWEDNNQDESEDGNNGDSAGENSSEEKEVVPVNNKNKRKKLK